MSYECHVCGKTLANASNLLHHNKAVHAYGNRNLGQQTLTVNGVTIMQHPFTCIVSTKRQDCESENSFGECTENYKSTSSAYHLVLWSMATIVF
jgi:hypothetical protein